jgi:hypothetical protein
MMPLQQLANEIIRLNERYGLTPVLVTPRYLSLRGQFFIELATALAEQSDRSISFDWLAWTPVAKSITTPLDLLRNHIAGIRAIRTNHRLAAAMSGLPGTARIQVTASIARPSAVDHPLVIGCCDQRQALPIWASAIRLGSTPDDATTLTGQHVGSLGS